MTANLNEKTEISFKDLETKYFSMPKLEELLISSVDATNDYSEPEFNVIKEVKTITKGIFYKETEYKAKILMSIEEEGCYIFCDGCKETWKITLEKGRISKGDNLFNFESFSVIGNSDYVSKNFPAKYKIFLFQDIDEENPVYRQDYIKQSIWTGKITWKLANLVLQIPNKKISDRQLFYFN